MSLGDNNKDNSRKVVPSVFSAYGGYNSFSTVDATRIRYSFWNQMLKIEIIPAVPDTVGTDRVSWDYKNSITAYLSHTKAKILANEIRLFLSDRTAYNSSGITSNESLLTICNGSDYGKDINDTFLVIRKIDKESGATLSSYAYQFNRQFYNSVRNYAESTLEFSTEFDAYDSLEIEQLLTLLDSYVEAMTYAHAYSVIDANNYYQNKTQEVLNAIADSMGIQVTGSNSASPSLKSSRSVFNQRNTDGPARNTPVQHASIEDVEGDLFG